MARIASALIIILLWSADAAAQTNHTDAMSSDVFSASDIGELVALQDEKIAVLESQVAAQAQLIEEQADQITDQQAIIEALAKANQEVTDALGVQTHKGFWSRTTGVLPLVLTALSVVLNAL